MSSLTVWKRQLVTARKPQGTSDDRPNIQLGGTKLWGEPGVDLEDAVDSLSRGIEAVARSFITVARGVLRAQVQEQFDIEAIEDRAFGAVLGRAMRFGLMDELIVGTKTGKSFRVYYAVENEKRLCSALASARELLKSTKTVQVRVLETRLFTSRVYNSWSSSSHLLGHLHYLGAAQDLGNDSFLDVVLIT